MRRGTLALCAFAWGVGCLPDYVTIEDSGATSAAGGMSSASSASAASASVSTSSSTTSAGGTGGAGGSSSSSGGGSSCGNGILDGGENCDGPGGLPQCTDLLGMGATGTVTCSSHCQFDVSKCVAPNECGDMTGLEAGAPWATQGRCPTGISRSAFIGPQTATVKWKKPICDVFTAHAVIAADGTIYAGCENGTLYAIQPSDGTIKGQFTSLLSMSNPLSIDAAGPGNIHIGSLDKNVYSLTPLLAKKWTAPMPTALQGVTALLPNGDSCVGGANGTVYCLDSSGNMDSSIVLDPTLYASVGPVGPDGTLYAFSFDSNYAVDGALYALATTPTLSKKWSTPVGPAPVAIIEPLLGTVYVGDWDGNVRAVPADGSMSMWVDDVGGRASVGAIAADETLYAVSGTEPQFHAVHPDGSVRWNFKTNDYVAGVVVGADGVVYIGSGGNDGNVYALDPVGGTVIWTLPVGANRQEPNSIASDGTLYVTAANGVLWAIAP